MNRQPDTGRRAARGARGGAWRGGRWALAVACCVGWWGCGERAGSEVVLYTSQDQVYAEPLLRRFEAETGIKVRAVFDSEAVKTVGLANRLMAERARPRADVFWNNEELRSHQLAAAGVLGATNGFQGFGQRSRRIVINTNLVSLGEAPGRFADLTNEVWKGRVAMAYPLFGTTATHFQVLRQHWGEEGWRAWCRGLVANQAMLLDGNSQVVKMVGRGEAAVGMTDSDDITAGQREGLPVAAVPLGDDTLLIPNTVGLVVGASHPEAARRLVDFLTSAPVVDALVAAGGMESPLAGPAGAAPRRPDWGALLRDLEATTAELKEIYLR